MNKQFYYAILLVVLLVASCVNDGAGSETSYSPEDVWEYNGDVAVLSKVIKELKNGSNGKKLENTFLKNDILWEESKFLFIDNKKRILVPFLSEDRSTVQGVLSLVKDAKGKTTFTITDRYQSMRENSSLPFWDGGTWLGYFLALDKDILGTENGSPGIATRPAKNKSENSLTMRMECSTQQTGEIVFYRYTYVLSGGEVSYFYYEITHTEPIYGTVCYDVPDPVIPPSGGNTGGGGSSGGGSSNNNTTTVNLSTFNITDKITDLVKELKCFNKNEGAKLTIYADQPITGSRTLTMETGHTFIGITQNGVTRSLGFYPDSPYASLISNQTSEIHDNSTSAYDVSITINISAVQLTNVISYITNYPSTYSLNNFNCSDFGIKVMSLGGLTLPKTVGSYSEWGFTFKGINPADLGEDMRRLSLPAGATRNSTTGKAPAKSGTCN